MKRNEMFEVTLQETKNCFSYDVNRKKDKEYAKLKSIERFDRQRGKTKDMDIHGLLWHERTILEVTSIDLDSKQCFVKNCNGFEWLTKLDTIEFCNQDGTKKHVHEN